MPRCTHCRCMPRAQVARIRSVQVAGSQPRNLTALLLALPDCAVRRVK